MKKTTILYLIIGFSLLLFLGAYISIFHSGLSHTHSDWSEFGNYFAGTIGVCFSLFSFILMYWTFKAQREQQLEASFQQHISDYYSLLNFINEKWLHGKDPIDPTFKKGREIFGMAVGYIKLDDSVDDNLVDNQMKESYEKIFNIHINVFHHYYNTIIGVFEFLDKDKNIKDKQLYMSRFLSLLSFYEIVLFAYYIEYTYKGIIRETIKKSLIYELNKLTYDGTIEHKGQVEKIIKKYTGANTAKITKA